MWGWYQSITGTCYVIVILFNYRNSSYCLSIVIFVSWSDDWKNMGWNGSSTSHVGLVRQACGTIPLKKAGWFVIFLQLRFSMCKIVQVFSNTWCGKGIELFITTEIWAGQKSNTEGIDTEFVVMVVTPQTPKFHHNQGTAEVMVTFGSLWCHSHNRQRGINFYSFMVPQN